MTSSDEPVRALSVAEQLQLGEAANSGPFVAWRDDTGALALHALRPGEPATMGRSLETVVTILHPQVSRDHAEVTVHAHSDALSVFVLDRDSRHGTEHRTVTFARGAERVTGAWKPVPRTPSRAVQLEAGTHDLRLAGTRWVLIGGVPVDTGFTFDRDEALLARPTGRRRDVLVELCRPAFEQPGAYQPIPSNKEIGERLFVGSEYVSDLLSEFYREYKIEGAREQRRPKLIQFARDAGLVTADDYR
jgi:hypothetical protein